MDTKNEVLLLVDKTTYDGWTEFTLATELQSLARSFAISATRKKIEKFGRVLDENLAPGKEVIVFIGADKMLEGFIVSKEIKHDASSVTVSIKGSGKTVDLIDCCVPKGKKTSFKNQTHIKNISAVCSYYGIEAVDKTTEKAQSKRADFEIKKAETIGKSAQTTVDGFEGLVNFMFLMGLLLFSPFLKP
jgi:prophage tail gpP-like protein